MPVFHGSRGGLARRARIAGLAVGFALGGVLAFVVVGSLERGVDTPSPLARQVFLERHPLGPSGERTTLDRAVSSFPLPVTLPSDPLAFDASVRAVWVDVGDAPQILIDYDSGVRLIESSLEDVAVTDPKEYYSEAIADDVPGVLTEVSGLPAMLIERQEGLNNPASVGFIVHDVRISIIGLGGQNGEELMRIASTMKV